MSSSEIPAHVLACRAATTLVGAALGAIGTAGSPVGIVAVGAVGYAAGLLLCEWEPVESGFRDRLDFESKLRGFSADTAARERAVARLAATGLVRNSAEAEAMVDVALAAMYADPEAIVAKQRELRALVRHPTGQVKQETTVVARTAEGARKRYSS